MGHRITSLMLQRSLLADVQRVQRRLAQTERMASSGLRVTRPSDDPNAAGRATTLRAELTKLAQLQRNGSRADVRLVTLEQSLQRSTDVLIRARELTTQARTETIDAEGRKRIAGEIEALHAELLQIGNTSSGGASLYAGFATNAPAFSVSGPFTSGLAPPTVSYLGDSNEIDVEIESGTTISSTLDGRRVFLGDADGDGSPDASRVDIFATLGDLWTALDQNDELGIGNALTTIQAAQDQISTERTAVGTRLQRVEAASRALAVAEVSTAEQLSDTQDADLAVVISNLVQQQSALESSLRITADAIPLSLLNFLR